MTEISDIRTEDHTITTQDETLLAATLYRPLNHNNHVVLIGGAIGMPQRVYRRYAQFLAENGYVVLTFDYRSSGASLRRRTLRGDPTTITDWAVQDYHAVLVWLTRQYPGARLSVVGHSMGGLLLGATQQNQQVEALLAVACATHYWRAYAWYQQVSVLLLFNVIMPILITLLGYFPSGWFKLGEDLPRGAAFDWRRSSWYPNGMTDLFHGTTHDHYAQYRGHVCYFSFEDDTFAPLHNVELASQAFYPNAASTSHRHIDLAEVGAKQIGHNGFFRPIFRESLWQDSLVWLQNPHAQMA